MAQSNAIIHYGPGDNQRVDAGGPVMFPGGDPANLEGNGPLQGVGVGTKDPTNRWGSGIASFPSSGKTAPAPLPVNQGGSAPDAGVGGLSFAAVENYWIQAGGSPQAAAMAAAVSDAESGLNASAKRTNPDGTIGVGLWLIPQNGTPPGSTDPLANARAAVQLSQNGTDWTQWCSTWSDNNCGENNGTYLGSGANALMSLAGQKPGASQIYGSTVAGNGTSGASATSPSGKSNYLIFGVLILIGVAIFYFVNRKKQPTDASQ